MLDSVQGHELIDVANQVAVDRDTDAEFFPMFTNSDFPSEMELLTERQSYSARYRVLRIYLDLSTIGRQALVR
ncbi:MAG: hypothetical protein WAK17_16200 [Candidatus Nitrosopolaris sp.]